MARYQKLLYNDNCILDTKNNIVVYKDDDDWNLYDEWKKEHPFSEQTITEKKESLLRWNQGQPKELNGITYEYHKNGNLYKSKEDNVYCEYDDTGCMIRKEIIENDNPLLIEEYVNNGGTPLIIRKETPEKLEIFQSEPHQLIFKQYEHNGFMIKEEYSNNEIYKNSFSKNGITVEKELSNKSTSKKKTYIDRKLKKVVHYFNGRKVIHKKIYKNFYEEYYPTKLIKAKGLVTSENKPSGHWKFYHSNGKLESEHWFDDGRFESKSRSSVFYEDGSLNFNIKHD